MGKVLNPAQVSQIFTLREVKDDWGEPKYSGAYIAEQLGVSESTVWRVLAKRAAYSVTKGGKQAQEDARWRALENDAFGAAAAPVDEAAVAASLAKVEALLGGGGLQIPEAARAKAQEFLA